MDFLKSFEEQGLEAYLSPTALESLMKNFDPQAPTKNVLWTTDPKVELPVLLKKSGYGSEKPVTLFEVWDQTLENHKSENAMAIKNSQGKWIFSTFLELYNMVKLLASAFITRGISERSAVAVLGYFFFGKEQALITLSG
jgi:long-chain-fatty-acid--CoA ligase ACSBG